MGQKSFLVLSFAVLSAIFFLLLIFFRVPFPPYPLMNWQDVFDLVTPAALIPIYWGLFKTASRSDSGWKEETAFMVLAALWVLGHGMHLAANSVNNLAENLAKAQEIDILNTSIYQLTYFFDEYLSHYVWHLGVLGFAGLLVYREWQGPAEVQANRWAVISGGILYGIICFCIILEGQTVPFGLPFVGLGVLFTLVWGREYWRQRTMLGFFFAAFLTAFLLFAAWRLYWGGFPQFTDVGWF